MINCTFKHKDKTTCIRKSHKKTKYCIFHTARNSPDRVNDNIYFRKLSRLYISQDGDWRGFIFPSTIEVSDIEVSFKLLISHSNFEELKLTSITFHEEVDISNSTFTENFSGRGLTFSKQVNLSYSIFQKQCDFPFIKASDAFNSAHCLYQGNFLISGSIKNLATFNFCVFEEQARFMQTKTTSFVGRGLSATIGVRMSATGSVFIPNEPWHKQTLRLLKRIIPLLKYKINNIMERLISKIKDRIINLKREMKNKARFMRRQFPHKREGTIVYSLFLRGVDFTSVTFNKPKKVSFHGIDLRNARFNHSDLREVSFIDNMWYQPMLKRNGLFEEVISIDAIDYYSKRDSLPIIENTYRALRYALEKSKDYANANDFFIGEMDVKRKQLGFLKRNIFSILACYNAVSRYGTHPSRCFVWLIFFTILHISLITAQVTTKINEKINQVSNVWNTFSTDINFENFAAYINQVKYFCLELIDFDVILYSFQTMLLQRNKISIGQDANTVISAIDTVFSIIALVLVGLFVMAIRTKIKRH